MKDDPIVKMVLSRRAEAIRAGTASLYECFWFYERYFMYHSEDLKEITKKALINILKHDPFSVVTDLFCGVELTPEEIDECIDCWAVEDPIVLARLKGQLRIASIQHHNIDIEVARNGLKDLEIAKAQFGGNKEFLTIYTSALAFLKDSRYKENLIKLIEITPPEWRAHPIDKGMAYYFNNRDWENYDSLRKMWDELPQNAHICECIINFVRNVDGIRELDKGNINEAINCLNKALALNGCPHLNTGGVSFALAQELLEKKIAIEEVELYLDKAQNFSDSAKLQELREKVASLESSFPA